MAVGQEVSGIGQGTRDQSGLKKPRDEKGVTLNPGDKGLVNWLVG